MGVAERKTRERAEREQRIVATARAIAEQEGWDAVTIRRLATEIEYSQPVLYAHFENRDAIVAAVALGGFRALTEALQTGTGLLQVATAYLDFARDNPALYAAMFTLPTPLRFAVSDTPPELRATFGAIAAALSDTCDDAELVTETLWAALHGLAELERSGRIRPAARDDRVALLVRAVTSVAT